MVVCFCVFFTLINTLTRKTQKTWKDSTKRHNEKGEYLDKINTKRKKHKPVSKNWNEEKRKEKTHLDISLPYSKYDF